MFEKKNFRVGNLLIGAPVNSVAEPVPQFLFRYPAYSFIFQKCRNTCKNLNARLKMKTQFILPITGMQLVSSTVFTPFGDDL
jgi:hypothetical protein